MTGEGVFKKQLWQCMIGQALVIKSNIEDTIHCTHYTLHSLHR
jgi:hypothetical protein